MFRAAGHPSGQGHFRSDTLIHCYALQTRSIICIPPVPLPKVDGGRHEVAKFLVEKKAETNWLAEHSETQKLYGPSRADSFFAKQAEPYAVCRICVKTGHHPIMPKALKTPPQVVHILSDTYSITVTIMTITRKPATSTYTRPCDVRLLSIWS